MAELTPDSQFSITTGSNIEAQKWVKTSTLSTATKKELFLFIEHFPTLIFFRENASTRASDKKAKVNALPGWLQNIRRTLTYVMPEDYVLARFDTVGEDDEENWFTLYAGKYLKDVAYLDLDRQLHAEGLALQIIGERVDVPGTLLAVNDANPNEQAIYEFNLETLWDFKRNKFPLSDVLNQVFVSYPAMLAHIESFNIGRGDQKKLIARK